MEKEPRSILRELNFLMGQNTSEMGLMWGLCTIDVSLAEKGKAALGKTHSGLGVIPTHPSPRVFLNGALRPAPRDPPASQEMLGAWSHSPELLLGGGGMPGGMPGLGEGPLGEGLTWTMLPHSWRPAVKVTVL